MTATHSDSRIPAADRCVLRYLLDRLAAATPDKTYCVFQDGTEWSYAQTRDEVIKTAIGLQSLGVKQGDHVLSWQPNGPDALRMFYGANYLGAVYVPINTAYKGRLLEHVIARSDARLIVAHADLAPRLADIDRASLEAFVSIGGKAPTIDGLAAVAESALYPSGGTLAPLERPIAPWDTQSIIFTSGTTGPSKAVLSSYVHAFSNFGPDTWTFLTPDDRYLISLPLFHLGGATIAYAMLCQHGSISLVEYFKTDSFWATVRDTGVTSVFMLGVMASFLEARPPQPDDRDHPLRTVGMVPLVDNVDSFTERFGLEVYSIYNMTELCCPVLTTVPMTVPGSCGRVREGCEVRLVDDNDCEVPVGTVGQFVVRSDTPWSMNHGYYKEPEATARAWRNGWFHTGDAGRMDEDGNFYFVDRLKDAIRRRGENISSLEVETEVAAHPAVREAAVIPVPNELAEDEVMAVVSLAPGSTLEPGELLTFLEPRLAHFMIPRFVRIVDELPKTPTEKVEKHRLRDLGVTADTWDREAAGIRIKRDRLGNAG
jgi:crotonobetaine/carnitine-CoA ligase